MAEPLKKDEALAAAVREAFQRHMENARQAAQALKEKQAEAPRSAPPSPRDPRLAVPKPANEDGSTAAATPPAKPDSASLDRLVAIASPQRAPDVAKEPSPPARETGPGQASQPVAPAAEPQAKADEAKADEAQSGDTKSDDSKSGEDGNGFDFGEALFIEIAPELDRKAPAVPPKMPKAASLDTPLPGRAAAEAPSDFEFRGPPSRERPRMSTANAAASPPQDFDLIPKTSTPAPISSAEPAPAPAEAAKDAPAPAPPPRSATRFGASSPSQPVPVVANKARGLRALGRKIEIPPAVIASLLIAAGITLIGAYFWANPGRLESLGALIAPPSGAPPETKVAAAPPQAPAPSATPAPAAPGATRSVSTVAITLDEIDQAVQAAHEAMAAGDVVGAREALESYRTSTDPRALFALAETYDPAIVKDAAKADAAQAKAFYEAAAKAGSQDTAERLARLTLVHAN